MHQPDAVEPEHVGDLVRVHEHAGRAVRNDGAGELGRRHHAALDMHVPVAEAGDEIAPAGIDHLGLRADRVLGRVPDEREAARDDGHVHAWDHLAGIDVDPAPVADDQLGRLAACGDIHQERRGFGPACDPG